MISIPPSPSGNNRRGQKLSDKAPEAGCYAKRPRGNCARAMPDKTCQSGSTLPDTQASRIVEPCGISLVGTTENFKTYKSG